MVFEVAMLLEISNIGKIQKAAIEMRGITVIAGNNNTGKSTYGKILYCMFNAFCNAGAAIYEEKNRNIKNIISRFITRYHHPIKDFINSIMEHQSSAEELRNFLIKNASFNNARIVDTTYNNGSSQIRALDMADDNKRNARIIDTDKDYIINAAV